MGPTAAYVARVRVAVMAPLDLIALNEGSCLWSKPKW